jgi:hypothetical protein
MLATMSAGLKVTLPADSSAGSCARASASAAATRSGRQSVLGGADILVT